MKVLRKVLGNKVLGNRCGSLLLAGLLLGLLAACGGPRGGTLRVDVTGLPAGTTAAVSVTGPDGVRTLTGSQTLSGLSAGSYTVTAAAVANYSAQITGSPALVRDGGTAQVVVRYTAGAGGDISGTVSIVAAEPAAAPFVPGEVIVAFDPGALGSDFGPQAVARVAAEAGLEPVRTLPLAGVGLYRASGLSAQSGAQDAETATLNLVAALSARSDVLYAHPNYLLEVSVTPNDPLYAAQWHYPAINLPDAWDRTTGSAGVTVAVVDSGILAEHPDLTSKLEPGYDFVSDASISGDGDGRDGDPADPSDASAYHGSHVAGTVAAATNNGVGGAGVSWGARLLPVRVLGEGNGTIADALDGILWSVGEDVPGVPTNPNPADVVNLSLGGPYQCSEVPALQDALDQAAATGAAIVVAAGNASTDASGVTPASCGGVITVGATTLGGERAEYSNYGARIDVMAPGGLLGEDVDGNGEPDGVLSTVRNDTTGEYGYAYFEGTSMASPHVAGAIALLKSVRPSLSGAEARDLLIETAEPIQDGSCSVGCGAGLIDVAAALAELSVPATPDFALSVSPAAVTLGEGESLEVTVTLSRSGGFSGGVALSANDLPGDLEATFTDPVLTGDSTVLTLSAETGAAGSYTVEVEGTGGGLTRTRPLSVVVEAASAPEPTADIAGTVVGACYFVDNTCDANLSKFVEIAQSGTSAPYTIANLNPASYVLAAFKDGNDDGDLSDSGDFSGVYLRGGQRALVTPPATGVDIVMTPGLATQQQQALLELWRQRP